MNKLQTKFRSTLAALVLAVAALALPAAARAQGALYVAPVAVRAAISTADPGTFSFLGPGNTSRMFYGVQFGGFYDVPPPVLPASLQRFEIGVDLRDAILHANNALLNEFLVGARLGLFPAADTAHKLHPYLEPYAGIGSTRAPNTSIKVNKPTYGGFVGADYDFSRRVSWRVAEVGYGSLTTASGGTIGASEAIPSATLFTITTGLTFRLP